MSDHDNSTDERKQKSRKPPNTAFRQQRLQAFLPLLTPKTVLPIFFAVGIILAPLGGGLLYASERVQRLEIDYTYCNSASSTASEIPAKYLHSSFHGVDANYNDGSYSWSFVNTSSTSDSGTTTYNATCYISFNIPNDLQPPVLMYYKLTNFYQNHRRYVKSVSQNQLKGQALSASDVGSDCSPLGTRTLANGTTLPIYPCGLIANSKFNDTISTPSTSDGTTYSMIKNGTAWTSDQHRFGKSKYNYWECVPPPYWYEEYGDTYTADNFPTTLYQDTDFQNWMRTAGLPTFSKLYLRNDHDVMTAGNYSVSVSYNFPVQTYGGTKTIVISTRTVIGGKNPFLGIAYIVVGAICLGLGIIFTARHLIKPRKLGDHKYLTWNNGADSSAAR